MPPSNKTFIDHLVIGNQVGQQLKFQPVMYNIVADKIHILKNTMYKNCYELNTKIIKTINNLIVYPLTKLFNQCIGGIFFPTLLKIAKGILIYKNNRYPYRQWIGTDEGKSLTQPKRRRRSKTSDQSSDYRAKGETRPKIAR